MAFIDRERELDLLRDHLTRPGAGLFVLYGRRRVGKTELLRRAIEGLDAAAYHVATRSTIVEELARLSRELARAWRMPLLEVQPLGSLDALISLLEGVEGPATLVIDEFPYMVETNPGLPGLIQAAWDRTLSHGRLKLVFCGSSVGMMERTFLVPRSPLFGRRTGQLRLGPLDVWHLPELFPWDPVSIVELAALVGGTPGYLVRLEPGLSLHENLARHVMTPGEPLYEEVPFLLREELREPRVYQSIMATIAGGARKFGEISSKVGLDRSNLSRYLGILGDLGLVVREVPVTERRPAKSRRGLYAIADPFVATWYAFVHPLRDRLERGETGRAMSESVVPSLPRYLGNAVEPVWRSLLVNASGTELVPFEVSDAGRYWSPAAEFDVVLLDRSGRRAAVCEVKWGTGPVSCDLLDALRARVAAEGALRGMEVTHVLVSRSGFLGSRPPAPDERLVDARSFPLGSDPDI
jgi:AAA+ ATPase superfamily predicted ATPase